MQQSKQLRMISIITLIVGIVIIGTILFKTKGIISDAAANYFVGNTKVSIITSDVLVDQSWGSLAYKGKLKIEEMFPVDVTLYSEIDTEKRMKKTIETAIKEGSKLIIGHGREFSDVFTEVAEQNPDIHFITIHGDSKYPNQSVYTFDQGEIEYFAALASSVVTKNNKIALIDAFDAREKNPEFETGLKYYKPEATFYYRYVDSRDDGEKAVQIFRELINEGVDVVYSKGNSYNREIINLAKKENILVIGYLDDQSYMGKDHVVTSVLNDVSQAYVAIMEDYFSEDGIPHGKVMLGANHGVYGLAPFGPMLTEEEKEMIKKEMEKYEKGKLVFP